MIYRTICTQLWTDRKIQQLTVQGKLLFVYLITNPHTHLSGIYYLPIELITKETGLSNTVSHTLFDTLSDPLNDLVYYDDENSIVFVTNMFRYQGRGEKNERSAAVHNLSLHYSPLVTMFLERYPRVRQYCPQAFLDRVSDTVLGASKRCPPVPDPVLLTSSSDPKSNGCSKTKGKTALPKEWDLTEEERMSWTKCGLNPVIEFAAFKDHALTEDRRCSDWQAAFRNWCRKSLTKQETRR